MNKIFIKISTLAAYIVMVAVNYLAVALPLADRDTGAISDNYPNLFAPAGYTFSIWGLIYTLLAIYTIYQFFYKNDALTAKINKIFIINALFNAAWLFAWHYDVIWLSVIIMMGLLLTLIKIADILRQEIKTAKEIWLIRLPFSVYFGWITVATIANFTVLFVNIGWKGFGLPEVFWTVAILFVGAAIGSWRALLDRNIPYTLVLVWAYGGILFKHISESAFGGKYPAVIAAALLSILTFVGIMIYIALKRQPAEKIYKGSL